MPSLSRRLRCLLPLFPLAALGGCAAIVPYAEVAARVAPARLLPIDGQRVYAEEAGAGEALILVHGFGGSSYSWRQVLPALAERRRVVALDLSGFGFTERPKARAPYTLEGQAALVLAVADRLGLARFDLAGHAYGGGVALHLAAHHAERVRSLLLVNSTRPTYASQRRNRLAAVRPLTALFARTVVLRPATVEKSLRRSFADDRLVTPELVAAYYERLPIEGVVDAYLGLTAPAPAPPKRVDLAAIRQPTLVLWGDRDEVIALRWGEKLAAELPHARLVVLRDCGHLPMEEKPAETAAAMAAFLDSLAGDQPSE